MTEIDKKLIKYHIAELEKVAGKLADAEAFAEKQCNDVKDREFPSAYKYGCMIALTRIYAGMVENNVREIEKLINNL